MKKFIVKSIVAETLVNRSATEPPFVFVTAANVVVGWHVAGYLAQVEVRMTKEEIELYNRLTDMITERVAKELVQ